MLVFLLLLTNASGDCGVNEYSQGSADDESFCIPCNSACLGCTGPGAEECKTCAEFFVKIQNICLDYCPLGYTNISQKCIEETSSKIPFDLDFSMLSNQVRNRGGSSENFLIFNGNSSDFYPDYDYYDPHVVHDRGFYFDGSAYMKGNDSSLTFGPVFTVSVWLRALKPSGVIFSKQNTLRQHIGISIVQQKLKISLFSLTLDTYTSTKSIQLSSWTHSYMKLFLTSSKSRVMIKINSKSETSPYFSTFFLDITKDFIYSFACLFENEVPSNFYTGFLFSFKIANSELEESNFIQKEKCNGCSRCPVVLNDQGELTGFCIPECESFQYFSNSSCFNCSSACMEIGCVRNDSTCSMCKDEKCKTCTSTTGDCEECIENARSVYGTCQCLPNFYWHEKKCRGCDKNCQVCDGKSLLGCSVCKPGFFMLSGICVEMCPTGFEMSISSSGLGCVQKQNKIFNIKFDKISGVLSDGLITLITGCNSQFYPDYDNYDPVAAYKRGFYFNGKSFMKFALMNDGETKVALNFPPEFFIAFWISSTNANGVVFGSAESGYGQVIRLAVEDSRIGGGVLLTQFYTEGGKFENFSCKSSVSLHTWAYIGLRFSLDTDGNTVFECWLNSNSETPTVLAQGYLYDIDINNNVLIGALQTAEKSYQDYFIGFIYQALLLVDKGDWLPALSTNCTSECSFCPDSGLEVNDCLSSCYFSQYPTSDGSCLDCDDNCKDLGCRDSDSSCNICEDSTCKVCDGFGDDDCVLYNCDEGYYKKKGMNECKSCHSSCLTCFDYGPSSCSSCNETFLLHSACHSFCPGGYLNVNNSCELVNSTLLHVELNTLTGIFNDKTGNFKVASGENDDFYPTPDEFDPIPVFNRGFYFTGNSYLQVTNVYDDSSLKLILGNQFVISFWLKGKSNGFLFAKQDSTSFDEHLIICVRDGKIQVQANLDVKKVKTAETFLNEGWNFVATGIKFLNSGNSNFYISTNFEYEVLTAGTGKFVDLVENFLVFIGAKSKSSEFSDFWNGFIYSFVIYSYLTIPDEFSTNCDGNCFLCPSHENICLDECPFQTWFNGTTCLPCQNCKINTCRQSDSRCSLCQDAQCSVCSNYTTGSCLECVENADLSSGECSCKSGYTWDPIIEKCSLCDKVICQSICMAGCPTGFELSNKTCLGLSGKIFEIQLSKIIKGKIEDAANGISVVTGESEGFYPYYDINDPKAGKNKGYYFNGLSSYMKILPGAKGGLVLSPKFSIGVWMRAEDEGVVFVRQALGTYSFMMRVKDKSLLQVYCQLSQSGTFSGFESVNQIELGDWVFVGVSVLQDENLASSAKIVINKESETKFMGRSSFIDFYSQSYSIIGAKYNTSQALDSFFKGFIFSISIWNYDVDFDNEINTNCKGSCEICPFSGTCPEPCSFNEYFDGTCMNCSEKCTEGCIGKEDCNLCQDRLCEKCSNYSSIGCEKCVDGASFHLGTCTCIDGDAKVKSDGGLYCETTCNYRCKTCFSSKNGDCLECNQGYVLINGLCTDFCPTGSNNNSGICEPIPPQKIISFVFNTTLNTLNDSVSGFKAFMGFNDNFLPDFDLNDPIPLLHRGFYFSDYQYVRLGNNPSEPREIILGNLHSISIWLRPQSNLQNSCILSKENQNSLLYFYLDPTLRPYISYKVSSIKTEESFSLTSTGKPLDLDKWSLISSVFQRSGTSSSLYLNQNGIQGSSNRVPESYFSEPGKSLFLLGFSFLYATSFKGFVYEVSVFNNAVFLSDPSSFTCFCETCTEYGDCLSRCDAKEFILESECNSCSSSCAYGCGSDKSCNLNPDHLCLKYSGFEAKQCTQCTNLALKVESACQCGSFAQEVGDSCICEEDYEEVDGKCLECLKHVQESEIKAYFAEDYIDLVFDFEYKVKEGTQDLCEELFDDSDLKMLGLRPGCKWEKEMTRLRVRLGKNANVQNESVLRFRKNSLPTNLRMCGSFRGPVSSQVVKKYDPPPIVPRGIVVGPSVYYKICGDLEISGKNSLGGYGRDLEFNWQVKANDSNSSGLVFENDTIRISNTSIQTGDLIVALKVTNWLGYSHLVTSQIEVSENPGIILVYDYLINFKFTSQQSKSIQLSLGGTCYTPKDLAFNWKFTKQEGEHSFINTSLIPSFQSSKIFISKKALGPGLYFILAEATDLSLNFTGSTSLVLIVEYSDLIIRFAPHYSTFNKNSDLVLEGSVVEDPDNTNEVIKYLWSCFNGSDCSSIISSTKDQSPVISKDLLSDLTEYHFSLLVTKGKRKAQDIKTYFINPNSSINIYFKPHRRYINNQENYVIRPWFDQDTNYTFEWTVLSNSQYELELKTDAKDLAFKQDSMEKGAFYVAQLNVTEENGISSIYMDHFLVNALPVEGNFYVDPLNGTSDDTVFEMCAAGWFDLKNENFELSYQFGFYFNEQENYFNFRNESNCLWIRISGDYEGEVEVFVRVYDIYGSFVEKRAAVRVEKVEGTGNGTEKVEALVKSFNEEWYDLDAAPADIYSLLGLVSKESIDLLEAVDLSLVIVRKILADMKEIDPARIDVVLSLIIRITESKLVQSQKSQVKLILEDVISILKQNSIPISSTRMNRFLAITQAIYPITPNSVRLHPRQLSNLAELLKSFFISTISSLGQSQSFSYSSSTLSISLQVHSGSSLINDFSSQSSPVSLPESQSLIYPSSKSLLSLLLIFDSYNSSSNSLKEFSQGVEFSLFTLSNQHEEAEYLEIKLKNDYVSIEIPLFNSTQNPSCVYWDKDQWSSKGCHLLNYTLNTSICQCSHTSLYSAGSDLLDYSSNSNSGPILVIISCIVSVLWVFSNCIFILKDQKEAESKTYVDEIILKIKQIDEKQGRVLETELAEPPPRDHQTEISSQKRDSGFLPTARIGIVGAYFHDKENPDDLKSEENENRKGEKDDENNEKGQDYQYRRDSSNYQGQNNSMIKNKGLLGMKSMYEEMKEPEKSNEHLSDPDLKKMVLSGYHETDNILSSEELEKIKELKNPPKRDFYYDKASDLSPNLPELEKRVSLKDAPKLGAMLRDESSEEMEILRRGSQFIPRAADMHDMQSIERVEENRKPKFAKVIITPPEDLSSKSIQNMSKYSEKRDSKLLQIKIEDQVPSSGSSEGSDLDKPQDIEKVVENTELFTQPNSPKGGTSSIFELRPIRRYSCFIVHIYISSFCYFHKNYSRSSRNSQGVVTFLLYILLQGFIIKGLGHSYTLSKGTSIESLSRSLNFEDLAISSFLVIISNIFTLISIGCCFFNRLPPVDSTEQDRVRFLNKINKKEGVRFVLVATIIIILIISIGAIEIGLEIEDSRLWFVLLAISFVFDCFCVQFVKMIIFRLLGSRFILPSF